MTILIADYIYIPSGYLSNSAIAFDTDILAIDSADILTAKYPGAKIIRTKPHSVVYPGFINTHVHLEFSSNKTTLQYGDFIPWLYSVLENRDEIISCSDDACMQEACEQMLNSGVTSFGAVSSYGSDISVCRNTPQRVTYYNELIGSDAATADVLYNDFLQRVEMSQEDAKKYRISPAIAIHSPYSVHPIVLQRAISLAKLHNLPLSAHLLESVAEKEWLDNNSGEFAKFFFDFFKTNQAVTTSDEFIRQFDTYPTNFIHCTQTTKEQREHLKSKKHSITHCPRSNRLLNSGRLSIEELVDSTMSIATDGASSNYSLNIWEELRAAIHLHHQGPLQQMADRFIKSVTSDAAIAMHSQAGILQVGSPADLITISLPSMPANTDDISLHAILHTSEVDNLFMDGELLISD